MIYSYHHSYSLIIRSNFNLLIIRDSLIFEILVIWVSKVALIYQFVSLDIQSALTDSLLEKLSIESWMIPNKEIMWCNSDFSSLHIYTRYLFEFSNPLYIHHEIFRMLIFMVAIWAIWNKNTKLNIVIFNWFHNHQVL